MVKTLLAVGIGSFFGGALRYYISILMKGFCVGGFPWATLAVNLLGCFVFGVLYALFGKRGALSSPWCLLLTTGFCGGFTTFSTFANESVQLLHGGNVGAFVGYVVASFVLGIALLALGCWLVK